MSEPLSWQDRKSRMYTTLAAVPEGKVVTYGQLASLSGFTNASRQAGKMLRELPKNSNLPWFRVVNASGRISVPEPSASLQKELLEREQIIFVKGRIRLKDFQWQP